MEEEEEEEEARERGMLDQRVGRKMEVLTSPPGKWCLHAPPPKYVHTHPHTYTYAAADNVILKVLSCQDHNHTCVAILWHSFPPPNLPAMNSVIL